MSCTYKKYTDSDGPEHLYNRMNQMDCAMKKFGGSVRPLAKSLRRVRRLKYLKRPKLKTKSKSKSKRRS
uniref:Uncharacterized protein n=1 Tax=viral metagenome TaxID=1070528 RepID=A0A6C0HQG4_9ZZZZ